MHVVGASAPRAHGGQAEGAEAGADGARPAQGLAMDNPVMNAQGGLAGADEEEGAPGDWLDMGFAFSRLCQLLHFTSLSPLLSFILLLCPVKNYFFAPMKNSVRNSVPIGTKFRTNFFIGPPSLFLSKQ